MVKEMVEEVSLFFLNFSFFISTHLFLPFSLTFTFTFLVIYHIPLISI